MPPFRAVDPREDPVPPAAAGELPYVDEHAIAIPVAREMVWDALERHAATSRRLPGGTPPVMLLGTQPPAGFAVAGREAGERLAPAGRRRPGAATGVSPEPGR